MLIVSAAISLTATFLFVRLLSTVIGVVGPLPLLFATLATIVGLAEYTHQTQPPDEAGAGERPEDDTTA
jgi:hypothetical protein